jgi:hypothetical protein
MTRLPPFLALAALACGPGSLAAAAQALDFSSAADQPANPAADQQSAAPAALSAHPAPKAAPAAATAPTGASGADRREISSTTASHLSDGLTRFTAPKEEKSALNQPKAAVDEEDSGGGDKPRNGIIRLPDYVVSERPPPVFKQREIMTKEAIAKMMFKKNPGLNLFGFMPLASLNTPIALEMYDEEERLQNMADLRDAAITIRRGGDAQEGDAIKKEAQQTFKHDVWGSGDENDGH